MYFVTFREKKPLFTGIWKQGFFSLKKYHWSLGFSMLEPVSGGTHLQFSTKQPSCGHRNRARESYYVCRRRLSKCGSAATKENDCHEFITNGKWDHVGTDLMTRIQKMGQGQPTPKTSSTATRDHRKSKVALLKNQLQWKVVYWNCFTKRLGNSIRIV